MVQHSEWCVNEHMGNECVWPFCLCEFVQDTYASIDEFLKDWGVYVEGSDMGNTVQRDKRLNDRGKTTI